MKKRVRFEAEKQLTTEYDRVKFVSELRDKTVKYLSVERLKKLNPDKIVDQLELIGYVESIFNKALGPKLSNQELNKINKYLKKFSFLPHHGTTDDDIVHMIAYRLVALCSGDKLAIQKSISPHFLLDPKYYGKFEGCLDWDEIRLLCKDVSSLARKCIKEFLQELRETGHIMTSAELAEHHLSLSVSTEEATDDSDEEFGKYAEEDSDSSAQSTNDNESKKTKISDDNTKSSQRSVTPNTEIESETIEQKQSNSNEKTNAEEYYSSNNDTYFLILEKLLAWIYELPELLQKQFLNSSPVKTMIENAVHMAAIYGHKFMNIDFANRKLESDNYNEYADMNTIDGTLVVRQNTSTYDPFDNSVMFGDNSVSFIVLPQDISTSIFPDISGNVTVLGFNDDFLGHAIIA